MASDFALGVVLALVAGAMNAGGFVAIGQFTSHMTGMIAMIADDITRGITGFITTGVIVITCFILGAAASTILIAWGRRNRRTRQFVYPVVAEILLILVFGGVGLVSLRVPQVAIILMPILGFMMGFQNATITRISDARIRTTHMTGMVTDIGMELGHVFSKSGPNWTSLRIHTGLVASFFMGSLLGGIGFLTIGFSFAFFAALPLVVIVVLGFLSRRAKTRRRAR